MNLKKIRRWLTNEHMIEEELKFIGQKSIIQSYLIIHIFIIIHQFYLNLWKYSWISYFSFYLIHHIYDFNNLYYIYSLLINQSDSNLISNNMQYPHKKSRIHFLSNYFISFPHFSQIFAIFHLPWISILLPFQTDFVLTSLFYLFLYQSTFIFRQQRTDEFYWRV